MSPKGLLFLQSPRSEHIGQNATSLDSTSLSGLPTKTKQNLQCVLAKIPHFPSAVRSYAGAKTFPMLQRHTQTRFHRNVVIPVTLRATSTTSSVHRWFHKTHTAPFIFQVAFLMHKFKPQLSSIILILLGQIKYHATDHMWIFQQSSLESCPVYPMWSTVILFSYIQNSTWQTLILNKNRHWSWGFPMWLGPFICPVEEFISDTAWDL